MLYTFDIYVGLTPYAIQFIGNNSTRYVIFDSERESWELC